MTGATDGPAIPSNALAKPEAAYHCPAERERWLAKT